MRSSSNKCLGGLSDLCSRMIIIFHEEKKKVQTDVLNAIESIDPDYVASSIQWIIVNSVTIIKVLS